MCWYKNPSLCPNPRIREKIEAKLKKASTTSSQMLTVPNEDDWDDVETRILMTMPTAHPATDEQERTMEALKRHFEEASALSTKDAIDGMLPHAA